MLIFLNKKSLNKKKILLNLDKKAYLLNFNIAYRDFGINIKL